MWLSRPQLIVFLLSIASIAAGRRATAAGEDPEALIREGVELRRQGQDARAVGYFRRAYELAVTPRTAAQLGLVELAVNDYPEAEIHLSEALVAARDPWVTEHHQVLEDGRAKARRHLVRIELAGAPTGTTYSADGGNATALPKDGVLYIAPDASASLHLDCRGHSAADVHVAAAAAGGTQRISVDMPALVETTPAPAAVVPIATSPPVAEQPAATLETAPQPKSDGRRVLRITGIALGAVGVAAGIAGVVFILEGNSEVTDINSASNSHGATSYNQSDGNFKSLQNLGAGFLIGGSAALVAGAGLYLYGRMGSQDDSPSVSFVPSSGFGVFSYRGTF
jgi:hypothetical protein